MLLINNLDEAESKIVTPWAVYCCGEYTNCASGLDPKNPRLMFMTKAAYDLQMDRPDSLWKCPRCGQTAEWDDENFEKQLEVE